jgi:alternate signal-mediated exported protein
VLVTASAVAALLVSSATYALWTSRDDFSGGVFSTGDLDVETGEARWRQVTPGVESPASGTLTSTPADFFSMPGDVLEIVQPVTTTLHGDNLEAGFSVDLADPSAGDVDAGRVAISFHVEDTSGTQVAPSVGEAELGSVVEVPGLTGGDAGTTATWDVVVRVDVLGDYVWAPGPVSDALDLWAAGTLAVRLDQVRTAAGATGGPA